jgi:hypothetical protein
MGTETVPETLDFNELRRLSAREEFINILETFCPGIPELPGFNEKKCQLAKIKYSVGSHMQC